MVKYSDITVVIQGNTEGKLTNFSILSVKAKLPGAKIIVSTWENADTRSISGYDEIIFSSDPGGEISSYSLNYNNINRQILSTAVGLQAVSTPYAMKLRSDMILVSSRSADIFGLFDEHRSDEYKLFDNRIIINNLYTRNPRTSFYPFHISDWFQFGRTEDLLRLWDINLVPDDEMVAYFFTREKPDDDPNPNLLLKFLPEQTLLLGCMEKFGIKPDCQYYGDCSEQNCVMTDKIFANNFVIMNYNGCGCKFLKYHPEKWGANTTYYFSDWRKLFHKYCADPSSTKKAFEQYKLGPGIKKSSQELREKIARRERKAKNFLSYFFAPFKKVGYWLVSPIQCIAATLSSIKYRIKLMIKS